jgi:hypothetical protein
VLNDDPTTVVPVVNALQYVIGALISMGVLLPARTVLNFRTETARTPTVPQSPTVVFGQQNPTAEHSTK